MEECSPGKPRASLAPADFSELMQAIRARTPARILVGRAGPAYRTATQLELRQDHAAWKRRLGRSHDHPVLVDPDAARHVHHSQQLVQQVCLVDQGRMPGLGAIDPWPGRFGATVDRREDHPTLYMIAGSCTELNSA